MRLLDMGREQYPVISPDIRVRNSILPGLKFYFHWGLVGPRSLGPGISQEMTRCRLIHAVRLETCRDAEGSASSANNHEYPTRGRTYEQLTLEEAADMEPQRSARDSKFGWRCSAYFTDVRT